MFRSGTENVAMIAGLGAAAQLVTQNIGNTSFFNYLPKPSHIIMDRINSLVKRYLVCKRIFRHIRFSYENSKGRLT